MAAKHLDARSVSGLKRARDLLAAASDPQTADAAYELLCGGNPLELKGARAALGRRQGGKGGAMRAPARLSPTTPSRPHPPLPSTAAPAAHSILGNFPDLFMPSNGDAAYLRCQRCGARLCGAEPQYRGGACVGFLPDAALVLHRCPPVNLPVSGLRAAGWLTGPHRCCLCPTRIEDGDVDHLCSSHFARDVLIDFVSLAPAPPPADVVAKLCGVAKVCA